MINYNKLRDAIANLQQQYKTLQFIQDGGLKNYPETLHYDLEETAKNSVVQCFEVCFDTMWKHFKKYLEENCGVLNEQYQEEIASKSTVRTVPGKIFNFALKNDVITKEMKEKLLKYNSIRNNISHDDSKEKAETALDVAENFINDMSKLHQIMTVKQ